MTHLLADPTQVREEMGHPVLRTNLRTFTVIIQNLRPYVPLFTELLTESPMRRPGKDGDIDQIVPYESVVRQLNEDTLASSGNILCLLNSLLLFQ